LYLSYYFKKYRQTYYDMLQNVRDRGDWESWIAFFLKGVINISNEASETIRKILLMREEHRAIITEKFGRAVGSGLKVLETLYQHPIITVKKVQEITGTTYAAANTLINKFVELGILNEMTGYTRNRRFSYRSYIDLFSEEQ